MIVGHDGEVDEEWEVEAIIRERCNNAKSKKNIYLVKWCNFWPEHNTWEPNITS